MDDIKDDKKEAKTVNFHQMELDDRILKVSSTYPTTKLSVTKYFPGDCQAGLVVTDSNPRESDSSDAGSEGCADSSSDWFWKNRVILNPNHSENPQLEGFGQGTEDNGVDTRAKQGALPSNPQGHRGVDNQVQQDRAMRGSLIQS